MTPTIKIILLILGGLWGLAGLVLFLAMAWAAGRAMPEVDVMEQWRARKRAERIERLRAKEERLHAVQT